jgi:hypothetical protein
VTREVEARLLSAVQEAAASVARVGCYRVNIKLGLVDQEVLNLWHGAPLYKGFVETRHRESIYIKLQMTRPEAEDLRDAAVEHVEKAIGHKVRWELIEMDPESFELL